MTEQDIIEQELYEELDELTGIQEFDSEFVDVDVSEFDTTPSYEIDEYEFDAPEEDSDEWFKKLCEDAFKNYRYIVLEEMFFDTKTGQKYTARQFNTVVVGNFPLYRKPKSVEWGRAARAFLESTFYEGKKGIRSEINSTKSAGAITNDQDGAIVNTYVKRGCGSKPGNVDLFLELLDILFEFDEDKELILKIMKWTVAHAGDPEKRLMFAPFITGIEGNGKSTLIQIMSQIIGERYIISPDAQTMKKEFSGFLENALLVNINESEEAKNNSLAEKLKPWITDKFLTVHPKGKEAFKVINTASFFITTNNPNALMQTSGSTRFCNFATRFDSQAEFIEHFGSREAKDSFYEKLYTWLNKDKGYAKIHHYLKNSVKYNGFKGNGGRAPYTKSHSKVMSQQKTDTMKNIEEAIEELGEVFTTQDLTSTIKAIGAKTPTCKERCTVLRNLGYFEKPEDSFFHQAYIPDGSIKGKRKRIAYPKTMQPKEAALRYAELVKERGDKL